MTTLRQTTISLCVEKRKQPQHVPFTHSLWCEEEEPGSDLDFLKKSCFDVVQSNFFICWSDRDHGGYASSGTRRGDSLSQGPLRGEFPSLGSVTPWGASSYQAKFKYWNTLTAKIDLREKISLCPPVVFWRGMGKRKLSFFKKMSAF